MSMSRGNPDCVSSVVETALSYLGDLVVDPSLLRGQMLRGTGAVADFEGMLALKCGFPYAVATCNATAALLGLAAIFRVKGREVWFPEVHWEGSIAAFRLMGARIRRYDQGKVAKAISLRSGSRRRLVVGGKDSGDISTGSLVDATVIEDSNRMPGITVLEDDLSKADIQVLSFGPGKPLSLGEGGAVLFRKRRWYETFVRMTQHPERVTSEFGGMAGVPKTCLNARIHPIAALIGIELLRSRV